jgi:hypothetical protein
MTQPIDPFCAEFSGGNNTHDPANNEQWNAREESNNRDKLVHNFNVFLVFDNGLMRIIPCV